MSLRFRLLNSSPPCLFSALQVALPSGTLILWKIHRKWRISSLQRVLESNTRRVPSNHDKQWQCRLFVSGDNAHKLLCTYVACVRGSYRVFTWVFGFLGETDSIETVFLSFIGCIFSCWMDFEREAKSSLAFTALKKFDFSYFRTIKYEDMMIFWLAHKCARSRQLTFVWKLSKMRQIYLYLI